LGMSTGLLGALQNFGLSSATSSMPPAPTHRPPLPPPSAAPAAFTKADLLAAAAAANAASAAPSSAATLNAIAPPAPSKASGFSTGIIDPCPNPHDPPGFLGFEVLRAYASQHSHSKLIGALRGQFAQPQHRFGSGHGTFKGPYYGIDQASPRLTLAHFSNALNELQLNLPSGEIEAIFKVIAGSLDGTIGLAELLREIRAEPCDASVRWGRKRTGQIWAGGRQLDNAKVVPTQRSGYSDGGYRKAPLLQAENVPPPRPKPPPVSSTPGYRVAPSDPTPYNSGANVLRTNILFGPAEETGEWHRKPPSGPPKVSRGKLGHSGRGPQLTGTMAEKFDDLDRWNRDGIGQRRPPPVVPNPHARVLAPDPSGFTRAESLFIGGEPEPPPPPPPPPVMPIVLQANPWVSGYNRSEWSSLQARKEAWANDEAPKKPCKEPTEFFVAPSRESGWVSNECRVSNEDRPGQCAFCRMGPHD